MARNYSASLANCPRGVIGTVEQIVGSMPAPKAKKGKKKKKAAEPEDGGDPGSPEGGKAKKKKKKAAKKSNLPEFPPMRYGEQQSVE